MSIQKSYKSVLVDGEGLFQPSVSLDCVIFGFHENELKVLLIKAKTTDNWALPGGFVFTEEDLDDAATRVLKERTGIDDIFLQQFHVFGAAKRFDWNIHRSNFKKDGFEIGPNHWLLKRFITVGYFALVEFAHVKLSPDKFSEECKWWDINEVDTLFMDHNSILEKALETLRLQLNHLPIGYNLLPQKFTMPELQKLYETILNKSLDRRNFQRKMTGFGILRRLKETRKGGAHRAPFLYSFDKRKYQKALKQGLHGDW
jgi:8-oxo-dGTP diphosphatase